MSKDNELNENQNKRSSVPENIVKITITKEAGEILAGFVDRANEGFAAGKITRQDFASFLIEKAKAWLTEKDYTQLRHAHYDDVSMFEAMYRRMRETGEIPDFMREAMRKQFQGIDDTVKKSKKTLTKEDINDGLKECEDAA